MSRHCEFVTTRQPLARVGPTHRLALSGESCGACFAGGGQEELADDFKDPTPAGRDTDDAAAHSFYTRRWDVAAFGKIVCRIADGTRSVSATLGASDGQRATEDGDGGAGEDDAISVQSHADDAAAGGDLVAEEGGLV